MSWRPPEMVAEKFPIDCNGYDKHNSPVVILPTGRVDLRGLMQAGYFHETVRHVDQTWERAIERMKGKVTKEGVPVTQFTCIMDVEKLGMKTAGSMTVINFFKQTVSHFESNYPEVLRKCYIINASRAFQIIFSILKPLISQRTHEKVAVLTSESQWKPAISADIPASQLPQCYGGTASSCLDAFVGYTRKNCSDSEFNEHMVPAGEAFRIPLHVTTENCLLQWSFAIESYDIDFYVTLQGEEVVPKARVEAHNGMVCNSYNCQASGVYTFHFDNSYSRLRSKALKYCIKLEE
jgi:hypothetical protein